MAERVLPSREKWNVPHAPEYAWDIAAEMTSFERRQITARWLEGRLMDREAIDRDKIKAQFHWLDTEYDIDLILDAALGGSDG